MVMTHALINFSLSPCLGVWGVHTAGVDGQRDASYTMVSFNELVHVLVSVHVYKCDNVHSCRDTYSCTYSCGLWLMAGVMIKKLP